MRQTGLFILIILLSLRFSFAQEKVKKVKKTIGYGKEYFDVIDKKSEIKQGEYFYKYRDEVQINGFYYNNLKQGNWSYSIGKNLNINAFYNFGEKDSIWHYYKNEILISEIPYQDGKRHGQAFGYYEDGTINSIIPYQNNRIEGTRKVYYNNGKLQMEVNYTNDSLDGALKYYNLKGEILLHLIYKNDRPFSLEEDEQPDSLRYFAGDLKNGFGSIKIYSRSSFTDSICLISEQNYFNGLLNGECKEYGVNGQLRFTGNYYSDFMVGQWHFYNPMNPEIDIPIVYSINDRIKVDTTDLYTVEPTYISIFNIDRPKFQGINVDRFRSYISSSLRYPENAAKAGIMGRVYTQFDVDQTGKIINVKLINDLFEELNNEAIRVVEESPNWIPGFIDNIPFNVRFTFPIVFVLR